MEGLFQNVNSITFSLALSKLRGKTPFFISCLDRILDFFAGSNMELKIQFLEEEVKCWKKFMKLHYLDETKSCQIQTSTTIKQVKQSATKDLSSLSQSLCFPCCLIESSLLIPLKFSIANWQITSRADSARKKWTRLKKENYLYSKFFYCRMLDINCFYA